MPIQLSRRLFTVHEYHQMAQAGILHEDDRVELIEGEIVQMASIGSRHAACVDRLTQIFVVRVAGRAIVRVQNPILSAGIDRVAKIPLYARIGITEAWLVDLQEDRVEVQRQPTLQGYRRVQHLGRGNSLALEAFPDLTLAVDDIFGGVPA